MNVKWLVEDGFFWDNNKDTLTPVLKELGVEYKFVHVSDIVQNNAKFGRRKFDCLHPSLKDPELHFPYAEDDCVITYGSIEFNQALRYREFIPNNAWVNMENLKCSTYCNYYGKYMLNSPYMFMTIAEIKRNIDFIFQTFGDNGKIFIRPDSSQKEFTGCLVTKENFDKDLFKMSYGKIDEAWLCLVSKPRKISIEYRFLIADKEVITGSMYKFNGEYEERAEFSDDALKLAQSIASEKWQPSRVYSVDISWLYEKDSDDPSRLNLLEVNGFNTASMYLCDWKKIVPALNKVALEEWNEAYGEDYENWEKESESKA
jgi:hypothetical protein